MIAETQSQPRPAKLIPHRLTGRGTADARCTAGLLTWNAGADGVRCVESLLAQTESDLHLLWIDNGSSDDTIDRIREEFPDLPAPLENIRNAGFCEPHNQMIERCETPYYLALNQDVALAPDYIQRLCDWLDAAPEIAIASGVMLRPPADPNAPSPDDRIESAGLVFPRARYHFHLGTGLPYAGEYLERRVVAGVEGAAMLVRVAACRKASLGGKGPFAEEFFAYYEEIDLAQRLARIGLHCGVDGKAAAVHRGKGSGGFSKPTIRSRFLANHWLTTLRNDPWPLILREFPYWLRGESQFWLPEYFRAPLAFVLALMAIIGGAGGARTFYREFERLHGPTLGGLLRYRNASRKALCEEKEKRRR